MFELHNFKDSPLGYQFYCGPQGSEGSQNFYYYININIYSIYLWFLIPGLQYTDVYYSTIGYHYSTIGYHRK